MATDHASYRIRVDVSLVAVADESTSAARTDRHGDMTLPVDQVIFTDERGNKAGSGEAVRLAGALAMQLAQSAIAHVVTHTPKVTL